MRYTEVNRWCKSESHILLNFFLGYNDGRLCNDFLFVFTLLCQHLTQIHNFPWYCIFFWIKSSCRNFFCLLYFHFFDYWNLFNTFLLLSNFLGILLNLTLTLCKRLFYFLALLRYNFLLFLFNQLFANLNFFLILNLLGYHVYFILLLWLNLILRVQGTRISFFRGNLIRILFNVICFDLFFFSLF